MAWTSRDGRDHTVHKRKERKEFLGGGGRWRFMLDIMAGNRLGGLVADLFFSPGLKI